MKKFFIILIFSCLNTLSFSQEKIILDTIPKSVSEKNLLFSEQPILLTNSKLFNGFDFLSPTLFKQSLIPDFSKNLNFTKYLNFSSLHTSNNQELTYSSFFNNAKVFNQASYKISDKFSFGGNSFGVQSVFDQPALNPDIQNMSTKGASMFMQYKVSKNFKIETRVSVSNHQTGW